MNGKSAIIFPTSINNNHEVWIRNSAEQIIWEQDARVTCEGFSSETVTSSYNSSEISWHDMLTFTMCSLYVLVCLTVFHTTTISCGVWNFPHNKLICPVTRGRHYKSEKSIFIFNPMFFYSPTHTHTAVHSFARNVFRNRTSYQIRFAFEFAGSMNRAYVWWSWRDIA